MDQLCARNMADKDNRSSPLLGRSAPPGLEYEARNGIESTRPDEPGNKQKLSKKKRNRGKRRRKPKPLDDTLLTATTATAGMQRQGLERATVTSLSPAAMAGDGDVKGVSDGIEDLHLSDSEKHGRPKPKPLGPCTTASATELATGLDLYATSNRNEPLNILNLGGSHGMKMLGDLNLGPGNSGKSEVALPADSTTEATIPIARAGGGTDLEVPALEEQVSKPRRVRKEVEERKRKTAADEERMARVSSTLSELVPADVIAKLLPIWRKKFEMLDLAQSLLEGCKAGEELHHTLEVISLVWDRWGGWIRELPRSALMSFAERVEKAGKDYSSGEESDFSEADFDGLAGLGDYLADGDFKDSYLDADSFLDLDGGV